MSEQSTQERSRVRYLALAGVAVLAIGAIAYLAVPGWSGISAASADAHVIASAQSTLPGPMPGAPTQQPTPSPTPSVGPQPVSHPTPTALKPLNALLVKIWNSGPAGKLLAAVATLSSSTLLAQQTQQYVDMLLDCRKLRTAVGMAKLAELIPDIAMQTKYAAALGSFQLAAASCMAGIKVVPDGVEDTVTKVDQTDMNTVSSDLSSGISDLFTGTEMLRQQ
jgi:uncharacterized phage infection (PIP) family protein YhgE